MSKDDWIYLFLLISSIPIGYLTPKLSSGFLRKLFSTVIGLLFTIFVCGYETIHSLIVILINCILIQIFKKQGLSHIASFIWCFSYLAIFRTLHLLGIQKNPVSGHSNAIQLFLTLRMIGLAFEVHDSIILKHKLKEWENDEKLKLKLKYTAIFPGIFDMICYGYSFTGLLTGPYFKYRTYIDMINTEKSIQRIEIMLNKLISIIPIAIIYLITSNLYDIHDFEKPGWDERSLLYKTAFMVPAFIVFRTRLYIAWLLGEIICIASQIGAYPKDAESSSGYGPRNLEKFEKALSEKKDDIKYDFETIRNIDFYLTELAPTVREGMRGWNMSVQYWLASCVYKRVTFGGYIFGTFVTMSVSAFWHGIHPGYYLSFLTIPPNLLAENIVKRALRSEKTSTTFDWICWFCKMRSFDYMNMGFCLLTFQSTVTYWKSIYFCGHLFIIFFIIFGTIINTLGLSLGKKKKD